MSISRRAFVQASMAGMALGATAVGKANAALPAQVFEAKTPTDAIRAALGSAEIVPSDAVKVSAADRAEIGDVVPVSVDADLPEIESITLVAEKNPVPVIAVYRLAPEVEGFLATRIKLAATGNVMALVQSGGKLHMASKAIEVGLSGCESF